MALSPSLRSLVDAVAGSPVQRARPLGGGCVADVMALDLADGRRLVVKAGAPGDRLDLEGMMLERLGEAGVPVPQVLRAEDTLLLMTYVESGGGLDAAAQEHLADILAALHGHPQAQFGYPCDTVIGGLPQPNPPGDRWIPFFAEHRLIAMGRTAREAGQLPAGLLRRVETLAGRLDRWLSEPAHPSLIHGDLWGGNVLCHRGRIAALIDPAIYHADPEIELAFGTLFGTLGAAFFQRYQTHRPLAPGFFEERRDLYNLYPLLVHVRLFGGGYVGQVDHTLARFGV